MPGLYEKILASIQRQNLGLYRGGPGLDYTGADEVFVMNVTLWHGSKLLVVQRTDSGTWGGVSGYIDTIKEGEDPLRFTAFNELLEECGLCVTDDQAHNGYPVQITPTPKYKSQRGECLQHVFPVLVRCLGNNRPIIRLDPTELIDCKWVDPGSIPNIPGISHNYTNIILPQLRAVTS